MDLHPNCESLAFLLGTWKGTGDGQYPTIESFSYNEEVTFGHVGKPFLAYSQKTKHADTGEPLHAEAGYLRAQGDGTVELVLVQPSGIVESHEGIVEGTSITFSLAMVHTTASAKSVTDVVRALSVSHDNGVAVLSYDVSMAAVGEPLTHHLHAELMHHAQG